MTKKAKFEFLEHTADVYISAHGKTMEEAFENAALATFEAMTDIDKVASKTEETVEVEGFDEKALLYNWLEALLVKFETSGTFYSNFKITNLQQTDEGYELKAKIQGEKLDPERHPSKVGVKAITYHRMEIEKKPDQVTVKFILDV
ncbi:MAG: archease [Candidatus Bathyarchaeia archaeon]